MASAIGDGEQAWQRYQDIQRVIETRYQLQSSAITNSSISMALQRLGEAVLHKYNLSSSDHKVVRRWNLGLKFDEEMDLSSTNEMLNARIKEWQEAIQSEKVGHDTWTKGRPAGYKLKKPLQDKLELPYSEIKLIVDMTAEKAKEIFERILGIVEKEITRLNSKDSSQEKIAEISIAMKLLAGAIAHKYHTSISDSAILSDSEKTYVNSIDLYSYNTMLDLKIRKWSLRQALNLSTDSLLSKIFGLQEALWGKTTSLENVEKRV